MTWMRATSAGMTRERWFDPIGTRSRVSWRAGVRPLGGIAGLAASSSVNTSRGRILRVNSIIWSSALVSRVMQTSPSLPRLALQLAAAQVVH
jgi:hypothetical protein